VVGVGTLADGGSRSPKALKLSAPLGSVGCWPLAIINHKIPEGRPVVVSAVRRRDCGVVPLTRRPHVAGSPLPVLGMDEACGGPSLGNSVGAIGWPESRAVRRDGRAGRANTAPSTCYFQALSPSVGVSVPQSASLAAPCGPRKKLPG
jgi:hypothetical protein